MQGLFFHFHCDKCGVTSDDYLINAHKSLPAWSRTHKFWSSIVFVDPKRPRLPEPPDAIISLTASMSNDQLTVAVAELREGEVHVTPDPKCPHCGANCKAVFCGYPPEGRPGITAAEFCDVAVMDANLSVRTKNICRQLGFQTLGQLMDGRGQFAAHHSANQTYIVEVDDLVSRRPAE